MKKETEFYAGPDFTGCFYIAGLALALAAFGYITSMVASVAFLGVGPIAAVVIFVVYARRVKRHQQAEQLIRDTLTQSLDKTMNLLVDAYRSNVAASERGILDKKAWFDVVRGFLRRTLRPLLNGQSVEILDRNVEDYVLFVDERVEAHSENS